MMRIKGMILCEGRTDRDLIGCYLSKVKQWSYIENPEDVPFTDQKINWYKCDDDVYVGIWPVGGADFKPSIALIMERERMEHGIDKVAIVTDHDDENAESKRLMSICGVIEDNLSITFRPSSEAFINKEWIDIEFSDMFGRSSVINFAYILVPKNEYGALETYMMDSLADNDSEKRNVIKQAKQFIKEFDSNVYLKKRRDRIKAELGVSLSIFSPDKALSTMIELINSVEWDRFVETHSQFALLRDI